MTEPSCVDDLAQRVLVRIQATTAYASLDELRADLKDHGLRAVLARAGLTDECGQQLQGMHVAEYVTAAILDMLDNLQARSPERLKC